MLDDQPDSPERRIVGTKQVLRATASRMPIKCVYIASDTACEIREQVESTCKSHGVECKVLQLGKDELGSMCGLNVAAACFAVLQATE